uniref:Uncharacterized protein n=1 Tax=Staphylococcus phage HS12 TaxID=3056402 RepID=A0AA49X520_9VIRU|nr:MAG: hypothetical protein [Staphylococcus phage HS12]
MISKKEVYYVIEVNEGIYLKLNTKVGGYDFTDDVLEAQRYSETIKAGKIARKCGGKVLYYIVTHEVK